MRRRPSGESGPPVAMIERRLARFGRLRGRWNAASARVCAGATRTVARSSAATASRAAVAGGRENDGGTLQQRGEPRPGRAHNQQSVVWTQVRVQQQLGARADQAGRGPEPGERRRQFGGQRGRFQTRAHKLVAAEPEAQAVGSPEHQCLARPGVAGEAERVSPAVARTPPPRRGIPSNAPPKTAAAQPSPPGRSHAWCAASAGMPRHWW